MVVAWDVGNRITMRFHGLVTVLACSVVVGLGIGISDGQSTPPAATSVPKKPMTKRMQAPITNGGAPELTSPKPGGPPQEVDAEPQTTTASFGAWIERCQRIGAGAESTRVCEVAQIIRVEGQAAPIAQIAIGRLKRADPLRLTLVVPLNVAFPGTPRLTVEGKDAEATDLPWRKCVPAGCFADIALSEDNLRRLRMASSDGHIEWNDSQNQGVHVPMSFVGLSQALDALAKEP